jgi:hypothetical protein
MRDVRPAVTASARPFASGLGLALVCALALIAAWFTPARAEPAPPAAAPSAAPFVHGLAPLPGGLAVPESLRPPGSLPGDGGPSPVIFPAQRLGLRFHHRKHVQELGLSCTSCHDRARTSKRSADDLLPPGTRCDGCHGTQHGPSDVKPGPGLEGQCGYCHVGYREDAGQRVAPVSVPPPNLRFDHALHFQKGISCAKCHGGVASLELATADQLPRMRGCLSCHTHPVAKPGKPSNACPTCHVTEKGSLLKTSFATGQLLPPAWFHDAEHGPDWIERHKRVAGEDSRFCANCHTERYCTGCHDGRVRPRRIHPNDFLSLHAIAARQNDPACTSCHQQQSFCLGCHQRAGVTLTGPPANTAHRGRFHPPKSVWTDGPRGPAHHGWEAERNLNACVSCHIERDCASCHATARVGGGKVNPHPAGFAGRCGRALRQNPRPCLVCHEAADPNLGSCR